MRAARGVIWRAVATQGGAHLNDAVQLGGLAEAQERLHGGASLLVRDQAHELLLLLHLVHFAGPVSGASQAPKEREAMQAH